MIQDEENQKRINDELMSQMPSAEFQEWCQGNFNAEPEITLEKVEETIYAFEFEKNAHPSVIIVHPNDGRYLVELMHKKFRYTAMENFRSYNNIKIYNSYDVEVGKWILA